MELKDHLFLSFFPAETSQCLIKGAILLPLQNEEFLIHEGDPSNHLFLILEGSAAIRKQDEKGKSILLGYVREDDFVGEFGIIDKAPRSADVQAVTDMQVAAIPRELILDSLHDATALFRLAAHTTRRMRMANQRHVETLLQQERMSLLGEMMGGILHDFRNPFSVISMASEMIKHIAPSAESYCEMILEQVLRMNNMAEDILDYARGETNLTKESVALDALFEKFCSLHEEYYAQWGVTLDAEPSNQIVSGDPDKLMRVLQNLIGNAAQAMKKTGGTITISARKEGDEIVLRIRDNGPGIPEEIQHNLFDAFATSGKKTGIGLGLMVTRSIIAAHGGEIDFETEAGRGTTFNIRLPAE